MRELVGSCTICGKELFCLDGFINGVYVDRENIHCFDCDEKENTITEQPQKLN